MDKKEANYYHPGGRPTWQNAGKLFNYLKPEEAASIVFAVGAEKTVRNYNKILQAIRHRYGNITIDEIIRALKMNQKIQLE